VRAITLSLIVGVAGCATTHPSSPSNKYSDAPQQDVQIEHLWSRGKISKYRMRNVSSRTVWYLHWFGQGPEPVAYCLNDDGSEWLCSEHVFLEGDDASGYTEWSHETILEPGSSVSFRVRVGANRKVGVRCFPADTGGEVIVWSEE